MSQWTAHVTVAAVVCRGNRYLMVEEADKVSGKLVFNQPAGHLEPGEDLRQAVLRETLEETGWQVKLEAVLGAALYTAAGNGITYYRTTFLASALTRVEAAVIDPDIHAVHWLNYGELVANSARMRSPLVLADVERHRRGTRYPLDLIE